jgi:RNA polymerase sigma-70 factor (ECF subfamily)
VSQAARRVAERYAAGDALTVREIEGWIRVVLDRGYPVLRHERDDLCQTVHARLVANLRASAFQFRSSLRTYVVSLTHHTAIDRLRRLDRETPLDIERAASIASVAAGPFEALDGVRTARVVHRVIQRLPASCRELWRLVFLEELPYGEIARRLGVAPGTIKSRMWACRQQALETVRTLRGATGRGAAR